jgi:HAD superfamily hydrolase (TIGR01509 family)
LNTIKAAIFDLDGTLVDSMWVWEQIDIDYLTKKGKSIPKNLKEDINHLSFQQSAEYFKERFQLNDSIEEIMNSWHLMAYEHYSKNIKLKAGALDFLNKLKSLGIKIGLATSNSTQLLEAVLINNNIYHLFDAITITDEVKKPKDNPDIYLLAAKKLKVNPKDCMVFEDIIAAVEGAKLAGMKVTAIYDKSSDHQKDILQKKCDKYIYDYTDLL